MWEGVRRIEGLREVLPTAKTLGEVRGRAERGQLGSEWQEEPCQQARRTAPMSA